MLVLLKELWNNMIGVMEHQQKCKIQNKQIQNKQSWCGKVIMY